MELSAPAKINLHLRVGPAGADGFHPLRSWMCTIDLRDRLVIAPRDVAAPNEPLLSLTCSDPSLPVGSENLVVRCGLAFAQALRATREESGQTASLAPVDIALEKRIPAGGGLAGGSSDGARVILGLNRFWNAGWDAARLAEVSSRCGSDLPFFFFGPSSVCTGRGQYVSPVPAPRQARWAMLALPGFPMPTPAVYRRFDEMGLGRKDDVDRDEPWAEWASLPAQELLGKLVNDLEPAAFSLSRPLVELRNRMQSQLGRPVRMSGSGSSLFTLYDSSAQSVEAANEVATKLNVNALSVELAASIADDLDAGATE